MITSQHIEKISLTHPSRQHSEHATSSFSSIERRFSRRRRRRAEHGYHALARNLLALYALPAHGSELSGVEESNLDYTVRWIEHQLLYPDSLLSESLLDLLFPLFGEQGLAVRKEEA